MITVNATPTVMTIRYIFLIFKAVCAVWSAPRVSTYPQAASITAENAEPRP